MSRIVTDVVIIGAGFMGCSAAFHLARRRGPRVVVIDKGPLASGMTKRSGALVHTFFAHEAEARLALGSLHQFQHWKEIVGNHLEFTRTGLAIVAPQDAVSADALRKTAAMMRALGGNTQLISLGELHELQPAAQVDDLAAAAFEPDAGYVDPVMATQAFATRAKELGATFRTGTFVKNIRVDDGRVVGVDTNTGAIDAMTVVVAAGAWSDRLLKLIGVGLALRSEWTQVAFYDRPADLKTGHAAFIDLATGAYFRPHTFGLTMGGFDPPRFSESVNPDHFEETVTPEFVQKLQQQIAVRLPAMASARFIRGHTGVYDLTPDGRPVISRVMGATGLIVAAGLGSAGFALVPEAGKCIAEMVADGSASTVDVSPFWIGRIK